MFTGNFTRCPSVSSVCWPCLVHVSSVCYGRGCLGWVLGIVVCLRFLRFSGLITFVEFVLMFSVLGLLAFEFVGLFGLLGLWVCKGVYRVCWLC